MNMHSDSVDIVDVVATAHGIAETGLNRALQSICKTGCHFLTRDSFVYFTD